ncbi:uncharacterized protein LOC120353881 [Nilaparvata lugens]|uniref:uncharacterized protein LOC120353881 n=1 Tax=Nilaparvata lugens TaxID=108931 RepID=UPI00193CEE99|nr:uncharacterized protein LOC120353881 [Nilaparvata lugens]
MRGEGPATRAGAAGPRPKSSTDGRSGARCRSTFWCHCQGEPKHQRQSKPANPKPAGAIRLCATSAGGLETHHGAAGFRRHPAKSRSRRCSRLLGLHLGVLGGGTVVLFLRRRRVQAAARV